MSKPWGVFRSLLALAPVLVLVPLLSSRVHYCESRSVPYCGSNSPQSPTNPRDITVSLRSFISAVPRSESLSIFFFCVGPTRSLASRKYQSRRYSDMPSTCQKTSVIGRLERKNTPSRTPGCSKKLNSLQNNVQRTWNVRFGDSLGAGHTGMSSFTT